MTKLKEKMDDIKRYMAEPVTKEFFSWTMLVFTVVVILSFLLGLNLLTMALLFVVLLGVG